MSVYNQEFTSESTIVAALKLKIEQTEQEDELIWMDSLSNLIVGTTTIESNYIVKETQRT
ncbi:hypothetical protein OAD52_01690 [Ulvibacter sp.]|nr:hypothetical protein [Ulvibacter sp.]